jgi:hypothetical protein
VSNYKKPKLNFLENFTGNYKERNIIGDDYCYLSHNCPSKETISLVMASHPQSCPQASMHSNNENFLVKFVGKMCFRVQSQTKPLTP